jgi:hypothetical protein
MTRGTLPFAKVWTASRLLFAAMVLCIVASLTALAAPQTNADVPPDATPQIQQISPDQAAPGDHVTVVVEGSNFSAGAYVSSVSSALHVESSKRVSATRLEAQVSVSASAQFSTLSLLVSNPASRAAEAAFKIVVGQAAVAPAPESAAAPASAPQAPTPAPPAPAAPTAPATPAAPAAPPAPPSPPAPNGPTVTTVQPPQVSPGFDLDLKISGRNFVQGTKVSFANPDIRVMGITFSSSTDLTVHIKVATDATPGAGSLYVVNPDDQEVEAPFEVTAKRVATVPPTPASPAATDSSDTQRFEAFHLGSPTELFQTHKVKGSLVVSAGTLKYQEGGKTLINIPLSDIKEIKTSSVATATFHITLTSGKTFHFAPSSARPSDARNMVDALRKDLPQ